MQPIIETLESRAYYSVGSLPWLVPAPTHKAAGGAVHLEALAKRKPRIDLTGRVSRYPSSAVLGKSMSVSMIIDDDGTKAAVGTLNVLFEFSTSPSGANPLQLATTTTPININVGASQTVRFSVPLALGLPTGHEYLVAVIDPTNAFSEANLSNKVSVTKTTIDVT